MSKNTVSPNASRPVQIAVPALILACSDTNDLYAVLRRAPGYEPLRCDSAAEAGAAHMVLARVAGMDTAVFGLADTPTTPLLFEHPRGQLLVATSRLSNFVTARHMPAAAWHAIWRMIFRWLNPGLAALDLCWTATVRPSFGRNELLPADCEAQALRRSADWLIASRMLRHPDWPKDALDRSNASMVVFEKLDADWPSGDGSLGGLEGFCTFINEDGSQAALYPVRTDCACETAMLMAFDAAVNRRDRHGRIAANLLDYVCRNSNLATDSRRLDPDDPKYGLLAWKLGRHAEYWGDDNARAETKLTEFLCRIQLRSERHPELNGAWYRAFNFGRWDHWACNSDGKWGPWCIETGWTQPWIGATLALRRMQTSLWDVAMTHDLDGHFDAIRQQMLPNEILNRISHTP